MRITIIYFSGTGNTWFVAKSLKESFIDKGIEAQYLSIEDPEIQNPESLKWIIESSDKVVIGYPIYGSIAPRPMVSFIENLPEMKEKSISVFSTVALASGDGPVVYRRLLENKGYRFDTGFEFKLSNNFNVPGFPDVLPVGSSDKIEERNEKAKRHATKMVDSILSGKGKIQGDHIFGKFLGNIQRKHVDDLIVQFNRSLYVEHSKCVNCNKCVKICPVNNITDLSGQIHINQRCAACMRCYHFCPTQAINVTDASLDTNKWPRYRGATKDYSNKLVRE